MIALMQFLYACVSLVNLPYTIALGMVLLFWGIVILGALDLEMFDFDLGADADADVDVGGGGGDTGLINNLLRYFNFGEIPLTILVSILVLSMWACSMIFNRLTANDDLTLAGAFLVPNLVAGLFVAKLLASPFRGFFQYKGTPATSTNDLIGRTGTVVSLRVNSTIGQIDVKSEGAPHRLNVRTEGDEGLAQNQLARIVTYDAKEDMFVVTAAESEEAGANKSATTKPDENAVASG